MSASQPIVQATTWREEWAFFALDGEGLDLSTADLQYRLATRTGAVLLSLNKTDHSDNFELLSLAGADSASGPVVRVTLTPEQTGPLAPGHYRHECRVVLEVVGEPAEAYSLGYQPVLVRDGGGA